MNAYKLAEILLSGEDLPVVTPSNRKQFNAEPVSNVFIIQNDNSPFEYKILLEGESICCPNKYISVDDGL